MAHEANKKLAKKIVNEIIIDLKCRKGFRQAFDDCDEDIIQSIKDDMMAVIEHRLELEIDRA